jgi:hypothetical protein
MYLIRPDGYVAIRTPSLDEAAITDYLDTILQGADVLEEPEASTQEPAPAHPSHHRSQESVPC